MTIKFRVIISGKTLSGRPLAETKTEVARVFGLQGEQLERMLCGNPLVVSRSASGEAADKLLARLLAVDLDARIEPLADEVTPSAAKAPEASAPAQNVPAVSANSSASAADELFALAAPAVALPAKGTDPAASGVASAEQVTCPKCGEVQPKRTLCRQCALDMPRYFAAQEVVEREAREERAAELESRRQAPGRSAAQHDAPGARLVGFGFSGRMGRRGYFASSLVSTTLWLVFAWLAMATGKMSFIGFGFFVSMVYSIRCVALRLHDTGRTGWLSLVALVPLIGALMVMVLLFTSGEADDNEYGAVPVGAGGSVLLILLALAVVSGLTYRSVTKSPEAAKVFLEAMRSGQGSANAAEDDDDEAPAGPVAQANYARNNRIDLYVIAGCTDCEKMRGWLDGNRLNYTLYNVDSDNSAAERLHSIIAADGQRQVNLPVLEVNGKVLSGNPGPGEVHRHLRQEPAP